MEIRRRKKDGLNRTTIVFCEEGTSRKCELKGRVCEIRLEQRGWSSYGRSGRGMRSLRSSNFSNLKTSRYWLQIEPLQLKSLFLGMR